MATSPVLFVYYPPLNDDSWPGVPGRHITEADWASFTIAQRRTIENATTQEGYTRRKVWVHIDLVDETEEERAQREAAEAAARAEYDRKNSLVRYGQIEAMIDQLEVLPPAEEFAALRADVDAVADVPPRVEAVETALSRVDPGHDGSDRQILKHRGGSPSWVMEDHISVSDYPITLGNDADNSPAIDSALLDSGLNVGASGGTPKGALASTIFPPGTLRIDRPILINETRRFHIKGDRTTLRPGVDMDDMLALDGSGRGIIEGLRFSKPGSDTLVQNVIRVDRSPAVTLSVHFVRIRDIEFDDIAFVNGINLGSQSSNLDMAQTFIENVATSGRWTVGETVRWQRGISVGSGIAGNVLNFTIRNAQTGGSRWPIYVDNTILTARDIFIDGGEYAIGGNPRGMLLLDGFRTEDTQGLAKFDGVDSSLRQMTIRNGWYSHNASLTNEAIYLRRGGNLLLENIYWYNPQYPTRKAQVVTGGTRGRVITFRNFSAYESPEEIWAFASSTEWQFIRLVFDGYNDMTTQRTYRGLYSRTVTASTNTQPYDGIMSVDATASAVTVTLPKAMYQQGRELVIRKGDAGGNAVTVAPQSGDTVSGSGAATLPTPGDYVHLVAGGNDWAAISRSA